MPGTLQAPGLSELALRVAGGRESEDLSANPDSAALVHRDLRQVIPHMSLAFYELVPHSPVDSYYTLVLATVLGTHSLPHLDVPTLQVLPGQK